MPGLHQVSCEEYMEGVGASAPEGAAQADVLVPGAVDLEAWRSEGHDLSQGG